MHRIHVDAHRHLHHPADEAPGERSRADAKARQGDAKPVKKSKGENTCECERGCKCVGVDVGGFVVWEAPERREERREKEARMRICNGPADLRQFSFFSKRSSGNDSLVKSLSSGHLFNGVMTRERRRSFP